MRLSSRLVGRVVAAAAAAAILVATLTPLPRVASLPSPWCVFCGELGGIDFSANVVMFLPLGLGLALALGDRWRPVLWSFALTVFVESMQIRIISGRDASLGDVIANTLGGFLGAQLAFGYRTLITPSRVAARRLAIAWAIVVSIVLWGTSWGFAAPGRLTSVWIQHLPPRAGFEPIPGTLDSFTLEGISLDETYPTRRRAIADAIEKRSWEAVATLHMHGPPPTRGVIARIVEENIVRLSVEQWAADLRCRVKTRASDLKLRDPVAAVPNVFPQRGGLPDVVTRATCGRLGNTLVAAASAGADSAEYRMRLSPSLGWVLVWPLNVGVSEGIALFGLAWLFALGLPAGYWLGAARWRRDGMNAPSATPSALLPTVVVVVAFALGAYVAPRVFDVSSASIGESLAVVVGMAAGLGAQRLVARTSRVPNADRSGAPLSATGRAFVLPDEPA